MQTRVVLKDGNDHRHSETVRMSVWSKNYWSEPEYASLYGLSAAQDSSKPSYQSRSSAQAPSTPFPSYFQLKLDQVHLACRGQFVDL